MLQGTAGHLSRYLFFISPFVCIAFIWYISSLQIVNTLSVCLMSSPRPNDNFIAFFVLITWNVILFQHSSLGLLTYVNKGKGWEVSIDPGPPNNPDPPGDHHSSDNNQGHSHSLTPWCSGLNPLNDPDNGPPGHNTEDSNPDNTHMTKTICKEVMGIFRRISLEILIKTHDPDTFNGSNPNKPSPPLLLVLQPFGQNPRLIEKEVPKLTTLLVSSMVLHLTLLPHKNHHWH